MVRNTSQAFTRPDKEKAHRQGRSKAVLEAANDVRLLLEPASQLVTLPG